IVIDLLVNADGEVQSSDVYRASIRNHAKLDYESVGEWLEGNGPMPSRIESVPRMEDQLRLQNEVAERLRAMRLRKGALDFETIEASPVIEDGKIVDLKVKRKNRARYIIENIMVS